jgi:hypothetical protein
MRYNQQGTTKESKKIAEEAQKPSLHVAFCR